jgi:hypothetical protein
MREKNKSRQILWGYDHAGHGSKVSGLTKNALQGKDIEDFHIKRLQSDPYIKESLWLLKDMEQ